MSEKIEVDAELLNKLIGIANEMSQQLREYANTYNESHDCELCEKLYKERRQKRRGKLHNCMSYAMYYDSVAEELSKTITKKVI